MSWIKTESRLPKHNQWVAVPWNEGFKCGQFDAKHPFGAVVIDRATGRYWTGFEHWKPLTMPKP